MLLPRREEADLAGQGRVVVHEEDGRVVTEELWEHTNVVLHLGPSLPPLEPRQFGILFLRTRDVVRVWSRSRTVQEKVFKAWPGQPGRLWDQWRLHADDENEWRLVAEHACLEVLPMFDAQMLLSMRYLAVHVTTLAWAVLRRLQPIGVGRSAEWRAAICHEHQVTEVLCLPVSTKRFAALYEAGSWAGVQAACRYGCVVGTTLYLPKDATTAVCTHAIADLFDVTIQGRPEGQRSIVLPGGGCILTEAAPVCAPVVSRLHAYEPTIRFDPAPGIPVVVLERVQEGEHRAMGVTSLDQAVVGNDCDVSRLGPDALETAFPALYQRAGKNVAAWTREAQMRRVCSEWTLEGMEQGCNLSSLGLSVLLGLGWRLACGVDAKVLVCPVTRAAMVLVDDVVVIDPTRTTVNFFDLHRHPPSHIPPKAGVFVEVRKSTKWHLAWVDSVSAFGTMSVTFVETKTPATLALGTHPWRRLSDDSAVTDRLLRRLLFSKRRSGAP